MPIPTLEDTYQVSPNHRIEASGVALTDNKAVLLAIKNSLLTLDYVLTKSSNGTVANTDDNWDTGADLVWNAAGAHSWALFTEAEGSQLLISMDCASADGHLASFFLSASGGFTGGSTTANPTSTDSTPLASGAAWGGVTSSDSDILINIIKGALGILHVVILSANAVLGYWLVAKVKDPTGTLDPYTGWDPAYVGYVRAGADAMDKANLFDSDKVHAYLTGGVNDGLVSFFMTAEAYGEGPIFSESTNDDQTSEYPLSPIGLFSTTATRKGRKGSLYDMWWGLTINSTGDTYPKDGSRQLIQVGDLVLPWNGDVPETV